MSTSKQQYTNTSKQAFIYSVFAFFLLFVGGIYSGFAQVKTTIDSSSIVIGSKIEYKIEVEVDSSQIVVFPEGQTFNPLEVIDTQKTDTAVNASKYNLTKEYTLTQFDSGHYTIPQQKIRIGDRVFFTDSLKVEVRDVLVDTTKQKMHAIKPLQDVEAKFSFNWKKWIWYFIIPLAILGAVFLFLYTRKKRAAKKEDEIPPYERAILALKKIDESHLLEQDSHKEYYSQLSDTARKYIDEEVYDHAMESTTDELITRLDLEIKKGTLNLDKTTVEELKSVLKTADMAKFAKSKPDILSAKADRNVIEQVIHKTKSAIPEPTEEELLADEEYRKEVAEKRKKKNIKIAVGATVLVTALTFGVFSLIYGYETVKDTLLGHPTKELASGEWITSAYGSPAVTITTPKVLIRNSFQLTNEQRQVLKGNETFVYGSLVGDFYVVVTTIQYNKPTEVDLNKTVEGVVGAFEQKGASNISLKDEEYETLHGAKGIKVYGGLTVDNPVTKQKQKNDYLMLNFAENGGYQQIIIVYNKQDRYAKKIAERILNSVELKNDK